MKKEEFKMALGKYFAVQCFIMFLFLTVFLSDSDSQFGQSPTVKFRFLFQLHRVGP